MSKAKEEYYEFKKVADRHFEGLGKEITNYVEELERRIKLFTSEKMKGKSWINKLRIAREYQRLLKSIDIFFDFFKKIN